MSDKSEDLNEISGKTNSKMQDQSVEQMADFVQKYNIPVDSNFISFARIYFSLQITIVGSILWIPLDNVMRAVVFLSICLILDVVRMLVWKPLRSLVCTPESLLAPTNVTLDARTKREGLAASLFFLPCASLIFVVVALPDNCSRDLSAIVYHLPYISSFSNIEHYTFSSPDNAKDSFDFLVMLQILCLFYLLYLATASVKRWEYRSVFSSKFFFVQGDKPKDIGNSLSISIAALLCFAAFYYFLSPRSPDAANPSYDWLGPGAMWMYGITEFAILFIFQAINKALLLSIQAFFFVSKNRSQ